jgi:DJ-1 family protein
VATCLVVLAPGAEEIETLAVADILVRAGAEVRVAATGSELVVAGSRGLPLAAHATLASVAAQQWDLVYMPGGKGSAAICCADERVQDLISAQLAGGRLLATICASVTALVPRRLAARAAVTSYPGVRAEVEPYVAAWLDQAVVEDGALVTSQGPGTAIALGLTLARRLAGPDVAASVAAAMLVSPLAAAGTAPACSPLAKGMS